MKLLRPVLILALLSICWTPTLAQPHTMEWQEGQTSPPASLTDLEWAVGAWRGEAFGGEVEEIWSRPLGGSMMGSFKLVVDGKVKFYELEAIHEVDSTLLLRLKHFHPDLKGWEERDETVDFRLVKVEPGKVYFDGYTFERVDNDRMNVYVRLEQGEAREAEFRYTRLRL